MIMFLNIGLNMCGEHYSVDLREIVQRLDYKCKKWIHADLVAHPDCTDYRCVEGELDEPPAYMIPDMLQDFHCSDVNAGNAQMIKDVLGDSFNPQTHPENALLLCEVSKPPLSLKECELRFKHHVLDAYGNGTVEWKSDPIVNEVMNEAREIVGSDAETEDATITEETVSEGEEETKLDETEPGTVPSTPDDFPVFSEDKSSGQKRKYATPILGLTAHKPDKPQTWRTPEDDENLKADALENDRTSKEWREKEKAAIDRHFLEGIKNTADYYRRLCDKQEEIDCFANEQANLAQKKEADDAKPPPPQSRCCSKRWMRPRSPIA